MNNLQRENAPNPNRRSELDINVEDYFLKLKRRWLPALSVFCSYCWNYLFSDQLFRKNL